MVNGEMKKELTFTSLISSIRQINDELVAQASRAVNVSLTLRNWLIGCYIAEYELHGADRAGYGDRLLLSLATELEKLDVSSCGKRQLYQYLRFYQTYPQIVRSLSAQLQHLAPQGISWKADIKEKLDTLEDVYTMAAENFSVSFGTTLEFIILAGWFLLLILYVAEFFFLK